jgi:hypothetical protein
MPCVSNGTPDDQSGIYNDKLKAICNVNFISFNIGIKKMIEKLKQNDYE